MPSKDPTCGSLCNFLVPGSRQRNRDILRFHRRPVHAYVWLSTKHFVHPLPPVSEGRPGGFPTCARPTRGVRDRALREHRESPGFPSFLFPLFLLTSIGGSGQGCPRLRASNEPRFIVRVLRAKRAPGRSLPALASHSPPPVQCLSPS